MCIYLSIIQAAHNGTVIVPTVIRATIHELSSLVMGIGESSLISFGSDGEFHPNATAADSKKNVAEMKINVRLISPIFFLNRH